MRRTNHRNLVNVGILSGRIPLISLVQFIAVAEHLNFRHAAKALGISQSSVSARVKALEDNLGVLLFERHARGVRLTDAGRHFMERVTAGVDFSKARDAAPAGRASRGQRLQSMPTRSTLL
ncbi:LysR family transcriptional regulator [Escherichia coli]|uniref:LysR family transcriptional regulator n=1 Tax=Escherichia coli TaxID=562 RepID=UPI0026BA0D61